MIVTDDEVRLGLARLDGYLHWQGQLAAARTFAHTTADQLPWLDGAARDDLVRVLTTAHTEMGRRTIRHIAARAAELRDEYEQRYRTLKRRLLAGVVAAAAAVTAVFGTAVVLIR